jgi:hypothetical protein
VLDLSRYLPGAPWAKVSRDSFATIGRFCGRLDECNPNEAGVENEKLHPVVAYHYFNAGPVIGDFHETSIELGVSKRFEFGYRHEFHTFGSDSSRARCGRTASISLTAKWF